LKCKEGYSKSIFKVSKIKNEKEKEKEEIKIFRDYFSLDDNFHFDMCCVC